MHYKIEGVIRRNKGRFIIFFVLWLIMVIALVMPCAYAINFATVDGVFDFGEFINRYNRRLLGFGKCCYRNRRIYRDIF